MADPVTLAGALFSVSSLAGIIGNLVASALWDGGKWVGQLDAIAKLFADDNRNNHDLLRALRRAECRAVVALCDQVLRVDFDFRVDSWSDRVALWLSWNPEIKPFRKVRRAYIRTYKLLGSMSIENLARMHGAAVKEVPELIKTASECFHVESAEEARRNFVSQQIAALDKSLRAAPVVVGLFGGLQPISPTGLPAQLRQRMEQHPRGWWDMLRIAFREELKDPANQRAQIAWQMDVLSMLPQQLGATYQEFEKKFDAIDTKLASIHADTQAILTGQQQQTKLTAETKAAVERLTPRNDQEPPFDLPERALAGELFGRDAALNQLIDRLKRRDNVDVWGYAGMGKTALAAEAVRAVVGPTRAKLADSPFPDGVVLLNLYSFKLEDDLAPAWSALANAFNRSAATERGARERAVDVCSKRQALVIVEGAEEAGDGDRLEEILSVLSSETTRLVLTRSWAQVKYPQPIRLEAGLARADGFALVRKICADKITDDQIESLYDLLGGHPLALTWAASRLEDTSETARSLLADLESANLPDLHEPRKEHHTLPWLFKRTVARLPEDARQLLSAAGLLAQYSFPLSAMAAVMGDDKNARDALRPLVHNGLLRLTGSGQDHWDFTHALAHKYAHDGNGGQAIGALCRWALESVISAIAAARNDDLSPLNSALTHATALLRNDQGDADAARLSNLLLYDGYDQILSVSRLDFARTALAAADEWYTRAAARDPKNHVLQHHLAACYNKFGGLAVATGNLQAARDAFSKCLEIAQRLADADPSNTLWQSDLSVSHIKLGELAVAAGDLPAARASFEKGLDITLRLADADPSNTQWQRDLSISHNKLGNLAVAAGDLPAARASFEKDLDIALRLADADPSNTEWQRDLSVSHEKLGELAVAAGDLPAARASFEKSLVIAQRLADADPSNTLWLRDLSVSHNKLGNLAVAAGDLPVARASFEKSLDIRQRLADADPSNTLWLRDLSVSYDKLGELAAAAGDLPAARASFEKFLDIAQRLADADPSNTLWLRDLSVSHEKLGNLAVATGDLTAARTSFEKSLVIRLRLADADPSNTQWQRDLVVSFFKLGGFAAGLDQRREALDYLEKARAISARLCRQDPTNAIWKNDLAAIEATIARLKA